MERRSSKREHHHQSHTNGELNHHRPMETKKRGDGDLKRHSAHHELSKETLAKPPLSGDDDYVRRWLALTDKEIEAETSRGRTQKDWTEHCDTKQKPQLGFRSFRYTFPENDTAQQQQQHYTKEKRRHCTSSDSSLLEPVMKSDLNSQQEVPKSAPREEAVLHRSKKRKVDSSDSRYSADSHVHHETFKKRDRYKTREDRYEPKKKKHQSDKQGGERKSKKKREKRGDKKKAARKAGEDLMNNFSSKSVAQNRLTIRPHGPGLFRNGRASSPAQRRGLADLVFSEMEFLQHPPRYPEIQKTSKSREKDNKRISREQDEISMFFRPMKTPLAEKSLNVRGERSSTYISEERSMYIKQAAADRPLERSHTIYSSEKPYSAFGRPSPSSDRFSTSRGRAASMHQRRTAPDTTSKLSENPTVVTWSETQISPEATAASRRRDRDYLHHASSTPEPIRISLDSTGIFRDTGIKRTHRSVSSRAESGPSQNKIYKKQDLRDVQHTLESSDPTFKSATSQSRFPPRHSKPSSKDQQSQSTEQMSRRPHPYEFGIDTGPTTGILIRRENDKRPMRIEDPATTRLDQFIAQYNPNLGLHQQQESNQLEKTSAASPANVESLREPKIASLSREQIAKNARVKHSARNIPVETIPEEPTLHDGKKAAPSQPTVSEEIIAKSGLINTSPVKYILQPTSAKPSSTATSSELLPQSSFENSQVTHNGSGAQESSRMESELLNQSFSSTMLPPQSGQRLHGMSREGLHVTVRRHDTPRLGPVLEATSMTGLPVRGPAGDDFGQPHRPLLLSPEVGNAPLYLNQIQRQFLPETPLFEDDAGNEQADDNHDVFNPETVRYLEDNEYDMLKEQHHTARGYSEYLVDEDQEQFEYHAGHNFSESQMWQPIARDDGMMEHYGTWRGLESDMSNEYLGDGNYVNRDFAETHGVEEQGGFYENQLAEEVPMTGFWRPNRPF